MITLRTNIEQVLRGMGMRKKLLVKEMVEALVKGMRKYESHIIRNQMSGRRSPSYGLNRQTGTLARSWKLKTINLGTTNYGISLSTSSVYARIHQFGGWTGRNHASYIPKRLWIYEEYKKIGRPDIIGRIDRAVSKFAKGK